MVIYRGTSDHHFQPGGSRCLFYVFPDGMANAGEAKLHRAIDKGRYLHTLCRAVAVRNIKGLAKLKPGVFAKLNVRLGKAK